MMDPKNLADRIQHQLEERPHGTERIDHVPPQIPGPHLQLLNLYGPTESGIEVAGYDTLEQETTRVSIGRPLPYVSAAIVDARGRLVPRGFPGELLIGGPSLALEYFHNPEETSRRFLMLAHKKSKEPERFYKTGDLVRQWHDGTLDFLGRVDEQMKVHGVRIEPGEIEAHIAEIEGIQEAAVVVGQAASDVATLVCFYVPECAFDETQEARETQAQQLKRALAQKLPSAWVPALFVPLSSLPLTRSGKRDRKSLSKEAGKLLRAQGNAHGRVPATPLELCVAGIWRQVLKQTEIGCDQNFFELGGDSVKTLQIVNLLSKEGLELSPRDFFWYPTIGEQARYLGEVRTPDRKNERGRTTEDEYILPLTPLQSLMLVEALRNPHTDAYWQTIAYRIPATIPFLKAKEAWRATLLANPALRTRVVWNAERSGQIIEEQSHTVLNVCDWRREEGKEQTLGEWSQARIEELKSSSLQVLQKVFFIEHWSAQPGDVEETVFLWLHHHVLVDGWSLAQCLNDFFTRLYDEHTVLSQRPSLKAYFSWLERSGTSELAQIFWKRELTSIRPAETLHLEKPTSVQERGEERPDFKTKDLSLSVLAAQTLTAFCQRQRLTASSVITCLWGLILRQYQDGDEICVGMTFANRPPQLDCSQELSGMLINTLPVPLHFSPHTRFNKECREILGRLMSISEYAETPYATLLACANLPGRAELFKSILVFQNFQGDLQDTLGSNDGTIWRPELLLAKGTSTDPLALTLDVRDTSIAVRIGWDERRYSGRKVEALVRSLNYWLEHIAELDGVQPEDFALVTPEEQAVLENVLQKHMSSAWAMPAWSLGTYLKSAENTAIAVYDGHISLSYAELRRRALRLATHLAATHHVRNGDTIVYIGKRGSAAVIAISAAWLLGASWCALDSDWPEARRRKTLQILQPRVIIPLAFVYELTNEATSASNEALLDTMLAREQIAYYIATSGSTGQPKLVALPAGGIPQVIAAWKNSYELATGPQQVLQIGSWTSDVFLGDFLKAISTGGTLVICPDKKRIDMAYLEKLLHEWHITLVESTPALVTSLMKYLTSKDARPEELRTIIVGSDVFRLEELNALCAMLWAGVKLYNGYGLSECTIESVIFPCTPATLFTSRSGLCPLGAPLPGTCLKIVDARGYDLPPGAIGELLIGGEQVARGYLTDDGHLDDKRVIARENRRYFKTGDLVRLNEQGIIEFFGRQDTQVKIRGYRVELGEIENVLLGQPGIQEAAVLTTKQTGSLELVAFLGTEKDSAAADIQNRLYRILPEYAVPQRFVLLPELPRNANGKIDRVLLQERATRESEAPIPAPLSNPTGENSPLQQVLVDLWEALLHRPISPGRSFFDQGGHSLLVLQLFERMKEKLPDYAFEIADLFLYPTIEAQVAGLLSARKTAPQQYSKILKNADISQNTQNNDLLNILRSIQSGEVSPDKALQLLEKGQKVKK